MTTALYLLAGLTVFFALLWLKTFCKFIDRTDQLAGCRDARNILRRTLLDISAIKLGDPPCWHELKTWPEYFLAISKNTKNFDVRKNDRDFKVGDGLLLREYELGLDQYTGCTLKRVVTYVGKAIDGVDDSYVVLSTRPIFPNEA